MVVEGIPCNLLWCLRACAGASGLTHAGSGSQQLCMPGIARWQLRRLRFDSVHGL